MKKDSLPKIISDLNGIIDNLKLILNESVETSAETSAEYTSSETSAEYTSAETSAEYTSAETSAEYSSAETSAETSAEYSSAEYSSAETSAETKPKSFFLDSSKHSWPNFKYLSGEVHGNLTKTRTMALDDFDVIHSFGYKSNMYIKTDTVLDNIYREDKGLKSAADMYKGYIGTVDASDGNTYFCPAYSTSIGILERKTGAIRTEQKWNITPQVRSGAEGANGIIYMPSYTKTLQIYTYNIKTGEAGSFTPPQTGFFGHIWGAAADKEGNIYMPPALSKKILKIDKFGDASLLEGKPVTSGAFGFDVKYVGATYVEDVNKVFCLPRCGKKILVINCADDSYEEIDLPADYLAVANKNKNFHGFLAPDGWLYSAFWADTKCFRINPRTYEIQWRDYSTYFMDGKSSVEEGSGIQNLGTGFSTCAKVVGNDVYLGLAGTSRAIKLEF